MKIIILQFEMKRKLNFNRMVIFMLFSAGPWKCKCLERHFKEAQGLSPLWFCVVKKSRDGRRNASVFSSNRKSHTSKWKGLSQQGCNHVSLKRLSALWPQISLTDKQGKERRENKWEKVHWQPLPHFFFYTSPFLPRMQPLSLFAPPF